MHRLFDNVILYEMQVRKSPNDGIGYLLYAFFLGQIMSVFVNKPQHSQNPIVLTGVWSLATEITVPVGEILLMA